MANRTGDSARSHTGPEAAHDDKQDQNGTWLQAKPKAAYDYCTRMTEDSSTLRGGLKISFDDKQAYEIRWPTIMRSTKYGLR